MKIFLDPGHGGRDSGAVGAGEDGVRGTDDDVFEKRLVFELAELADIALRRAGHEVRWSRTTDVNVSERASVLLANEWPADAYLSLHANGVTDPAAHGYEVLHWRRSSRSISLAAGILQGFSKRFPDHRERGLKERFPESELARLDLGPEFSRGATVLGGTTMPAVILEPGFVTNPEEAAWLAEFETQAAIAGAIVEAVGLFFTSV